MEVHEEKKGGGGEATKENVLDLLPGQGIGQMGNACCANRGAQVWVPSVRVKLGMAAWHRMQTYSGKAPLQESGHPGKLLVTIKAQNNGHKSVLETGTVGGI